MPIRVALVVEDVRFLQFLVPAVEKVAGSLGSDIHWTARESISGCRPAKLHNVVDAVAGAADLVVVGADADGQHHASRGSGHKRKRMALAELLGQREHISFAVAQPSVEAWLFCEPNAFADALSQALAVGFRKPGQWPVPKTEKQAKEYLGRLVREGADANLPRAGFEFAAEIVSRLSLESTSNKSLTDWVRELRRSLSLH